MRIKLYCFFFFLFSFSVSFAQVSADYAVQLTATTIENPPSITLHWNQYPGATSYLVYRKSEGSSSWGTYLANLSGDTLEYKDSNVQWDSLYEYRVKRSGNGISADGYLTGAIKLHSKDYKGWLLLVVDSTIADSLQTELYRLMKDISHDGWGVKRIDVSPNDTVSGVKALIAAEYNSNSDLKAVLLFGHIPVPYSGALNPDGHPDHYGAWPSDVYYAEMDADWTDNSINVITASRPENWNTPGDGKFDETYLPDNVDLQIGRVDLHNLPSFPSTETQLLQQYLNKDHDYRVGNFTAQSRGLVDDNFGAFGGEAFASCGFRNFAPLLGDSS
ncbi:MAG TPA: fibronectin type III domain-containing protein, partial [Chitinophagales bacterium]|nr:fibronectin type III domain-containing protein [Chitinophagales bacterium]